jgi:hypothetical protein
MENCLFPPSEPPRRASSAAARPGAREEARTRKEGQPCSTAAILCRSEVRLRHQTPTAERCDLPLATRRLAGLSATPWRPMTATTVSRAGDTSLPRATLTSDAGAQSCAHANPCCERHVPTARWPRWDAAPSVAAAASHNFPARRGTSLPRKTKKDQEQERRRARLLLEARDALCLVMLAACTVALIRSQMLTAEPPMVPACELFALAAVLRALLGPKEPPSRGFRRA